MVGSAAAHYPLPTTHWFLTMTAEPVRRKVTITNPQGLHLRPIQMFVEVAGKFQSNVYVMKEGGERINGKSPLGLLGLGAEQGTELILEVSGPDQDAALEALADLIVNVRAQEDEPPKEVSSP